jgi:predicted helicase
MADEKSPITLDQLTHNAPFPHIERYAYRSFDRQWFFADSRLGDYLRPDLWRSHGNKQVYLASSVVLELGIGPAMTVSAHVPDRHYFAGRGGKDILPLYRDAKSSEPNLFPCMLTTFGKLFKRKLSPEDMLAYFYGILAHPAFADRYAQELDSRELRVPITKDAKLFEKVRAAGARLLWLHTYGERFVPKGKHRGRIPHGSVKCVKAVPGQCDAYPETFEYNEKTRTLRVGDGEFRPVAREVYDYEVSGLKVVQSWLKYRMKRGAGKKSSPLDDIRPDRWTSQFTTELLELLWVLEATVAGYAEQAKLLEAVIAGPCFKVGELPPVPPEMRKPPAARVSGDDFFDDVDEE